MSEIIGILAWGNLNILFVGQRHFGGGNKHIKG